MKHIRTLSVKRPANADEVLSTFSSLISLLSAVLSLFTEAGALFGIDLEQKGSDTSE